MKHILQQNETYFTAKLLVEKQRKPTAQLASKYYQDILRHEILNTTL